MKNNTPISILNDLTYLEDKPAVKVLLETSFTKEIRIAMKKGQKLKKHQTRFPIVINLVQGKIMLGVDSEVLNLTSGDLIALEGDVPHDLECIQDCIIRLTLSNSDDKKRVETMAR